MKRRRNRHRSLSLLPGCETEEETMSWLTRSIHDEPRRELPMLRLVIGSEAHLEGCSCEHSSWEVGATHDRLMRQLPHIFQEKGKYVNQDVCSRGKRKEKTSAASVLVGKFLKGWKFPSSGYISFPGLCGPKEKITR